MRLRAVLLVVLPVVLLLGMGWFSARSRRARLARVAPPRVPTHREERPRTDPAVQATLRDIDDLRNYRKKRDIPVGGVGVPEYQDKLEKIKAASAGNLRYLEEIVLDRNETPGLRVELLNLIASHPGEETRLFLASMIGDNVEGAAVRIAAVYQLVPYKDRATFEAFVRAWRDPAPFDGRYHFMVALGECGNAGAVPILREGLASHQPPAIRSHAAQGLGGFAGDLAVRADLRTLALSDPLSAVRQNAVRALARSSAPEVEAALREIAGTSTDADTKRLAEQVLASRVKK